MASKASNGRLPHATDRLNEALREAEDALAELGLGVSASVPLDGDRALHFRKRANEFVLIVTRNGDDANENTVLTTSRKTRLEVAGKLPALRDALLEAYEVELRRVEGGIDEVRAFTDSLRGIRRPP